MNRDPITPPVPSSQLPLTGERTVPGIPEENYWFVRHVAAYRLAARYCRGGRVLDAGCGEGYGAALLAAAGNDVLGVDVAAEVVAHARAAYPRAEHPRVEFLDADLCALPLPDGAVDAVVSLQVIEHLHDVAGYVAEMARVLRPGGTFVCATPNRLTFTPGSDTPVNPFHVKEFDAGELRATLAAEFDDVRILGVHHGWRLRAVERVARRTFPDLVLAAPAPTWPWWLRTAVGLVRPADFRITPRRIDGSLDLVALATAR